jgi:hypothetical protein
MEINKTELYKSLYKQALRKFKGKHAKYDAASAAMTLVLELPTRKHRLSKAELRQARLAMELR